MIDQLTHLLTCELKQIQTLFKKTQMKLRSYFNVKIVK